jgi:hypothetical protein
MAWMWALTKVPWGTIIRHGPTIVDAARQLYGTTRRPGIGEDTRSRRPDDLAALHRAVLELETRETQQAALLEGLARQAEAMATALQVLRTRLRLALCGAGLAMVVAVVAIVLALWRT